MRGTLTVDGNDRLGLRWGPPAAQPAFKCHSPEIQTYDDQDVDPIPSNTIDFEYTTTRNAEPFFPDSEIHVVDVAPLQETFTGIHASEVGGWLNAEITAWVTFVSERVVQNQKPRCQANFYFRQNC